MELPHRLEQALLETFEELDRGRGRRIQREFLVRVAAERSGFSPKEVTAGLERLLLRRAVVADVSDRILLPPGRASAEADIL